MGKTGFRGERKEILTPSLSQGEGECRDGKAEETSPFTHTPLLQCTYTAVAGYFQRGNVAMGKRINKLENLEISKFVGGV